jgi:hypothetical protein
MEWIIGVIIVAIIVFAILSQTEWGKGVSNAAKILNEYQEKEKNESIDDIDDYTSSEFNDSSIEDILFELEEYTEDDDSIELPIRGINFRNLTDANIGSFDGFIMPDEGNEHDKYAIGVYGSDDTHFGFIEKGQKALYDKIKAGNGFINVKLDVDTFIDEETGKVRFHGTVTIDKAELL